MARTRRPYRASPDELRAIDKALAEGGAEAVIAAAITRHAKGDPDALAQAILAALDRAGYEVRPKSDLIPIKSAKPTPTQ